MNFQNQRHICNATVAIKKGIKAENYPSVQPCDSMLGPISCRLQVKDTKTMMSGSQAMVALDPGSVLVGKTGWTDQGSIKKAL